MAQLAQFDSTGFSLCSLSSSSSTAKYAHNHSNNVPDCPVRSLHTRQTSNDSALVTTHELQVPTITARTATLKYRSHPPPSVRSCSPCVPPPRHRPHPFAPILCLCSHFPALDHRARFPHRTPAQVGCPPHHPRGHRLHCASRRHGQHTRRAALQRIALIRCSPRFTSHPLPPPLRVRRRPRPQLRITSTTSSRHPRSLQRKDRLSRCWPWDRRRVASL